MHAIGKGDAMDAKVTCRTPTDGRDGVTCIPAWKYDLLSEAIRAALANGEMGLNTLKAEVATSIPRDRLGKLGSLGWHFTCVRLEMEVRGEVRRRPKVSPIRVSLAPPSDA